jgi:RND superfamily putative drug exporter
MSRLVRALVRWWWAVIAAWLVLAGVLFAVAPPFEEVATFDNTAFLSEDAPSMVGGRLLAEGWTGDDFGRTAAIAYVRDGGPLTSADLAVVEDTLAWLRSPDAPPAVGPITTHLEDPTLRSAFLSDDGHATFVLVGLEVPAFTPPANETIAALRAHLATLQVPDGLEVHVTGSTAVAADQAAATLLARAGMDVSSLFETFSIVIVFGAGTDYCIFLISRYHEELDLAERHGYAPSRPLRGGTLAAALLVLAAVLGSSAATTIAGFSAQAVAEFGMFRTMGPAMALAVAITLAAALTLTPALMRLFGRLLFWPSSGVRGSHGTEGLLIETHRDRLRLPAYDRTPRAGR